MCHLPRWLWALHPAPLSHPRKQVFRTSLFDPQMTQIYLSFPCSWVGMLPCRSAAHQPSCIRLHPGVPTRSVDTRVWWSSLREIRKRPLIISRSYAPAWERPPRDSAVDVSSSGFYVICGTINRADTAEAGCDVLLLGYGFSDLLRGRCAIVKLASTLSEPPGVEEETMSRRGTSIAGRVTLFYILLGGLWTFYSDWLAALFVTKHLPFSSLHIGKDGMFVLCGAVLIYGLLRYEMRTRARVEQELYRVNRALRLLSDFNQALVRAESEAELLQYTCQRIIGTSGYRLAWVGFAEPDATQSVRPVAQAGYADGYLDAVQISWGEGIYGAGPTGRAIRSGQPCVVRNILTDPAYVPWRTQALRRGYASAVALPLCDGTGTFGALNIYAAEADAFDADEMKLLVELADDLAYGLRTLRMRAAHQQAEAALLAAYERHNKILESISDAFFALDNAWNFVYVNCEAERMLRHSRGELVGQNVWEVFPAAIGSQFYHAYHQAQAEQVALTFEAFYAPFNTWFDVHVYPSVDGLSVYFRDATERKCREEELRRYAARLSAMRDIDRALLAVRAPASIAGAVLEQLPALVAYQYATVTLFDEAANSARVLAMDRCGVVQIEPGIGLPLDGFRSMVKLWQGQPHLVHDLLEQDPLLAFDNAQLAEGMRSYASIPLIAQEKLIGAFTLGTTSPGTLALGDLEVVHEVADQLALVLQQALLLTQLHNGRERLFALSRQLLDVQEAERRRIARELHDEIGQTLTGLHLLLEMSGRVPAKREQSLHEAQVLISELLNQVRELSLNLRPAMLDDLGLLPTLRWHFSRYMQQTGIRVLFQQTGVEQRFASNIETGVYRLVQEALTNVARHARVAELTVQLCADADTLSISISDKGVGFVPEMVLAEQITGGLSGMCERVQLLGGRLWVDAAPGAGTRLSATLPLYEAVPAH